jgi:hypothetical protein
MKKQHGNGPTLVPHSGKVSAPPPFWQFRPSLWRHAFGPRRAKLFSKRLRWVIAVIRDGFFDLVSDDPHDMDSVADHVGGASFAFRSDGH